MTEISVIVPVYNVENYIRRCIDSLTAQTFKKIEIIIIDDGAKDSSGAICDEYALKDDRIRVIHKENGGVSSARNAGLDNAVGKYVMFCDPDDYVEPTWCEKLYGSIRKNGFYGVCGFSIVDAESGEVISENVPHFNDGEYAQTDSHRLLFLYNHGLFRAIWNAVFNLSIIKAHGIRFREEYSRCEDTLFAIEYLQTKEGSIHYVEEKLYSYAIGKADSLTKKIPSNYWQGELNWLRSIQPLMCAYDISFSNYSGKYYSQVLYAVINALSGITSERGKLITILKKEKVVLNTPECVAALKHGDFSDINAMYAAILRSRNGFLIWLFHSAIKIKRKLKEK